MAPLARINYYELYLVVRAEVKLLDGGMALLPSLFNVDSFRVSFNVL